MKWKLLETLEGARDDSRKFVDFTVMEVAGVDWWAERGKLESFGKIDRLWLSVILSGKILDE